jgi:hypothetical protein
MNTEWSLLTMHNCRAVKERLTELILDGESHDEMSAELNTCAECRAEFDALNATLRMTTRVRETAVPAESYWPGYHTRLREKLSQAKLSHAQVRRRKENTGASFALLRLCVNSLLRPVRVPLAVAALIICCLGLFAFRIARRPVTTQDPVIVHVPVQVPVVKEKVVTRVVYRDRYLPARGSKRAGQGSQAENTFAKSQKPRRDDIPMLTGFKPAEDVKLTVIKGGFPNEK